MIKIILLVGFLVLLGNLVVLDYFVFKRDAAPQVLTTRILVTPTLAPVEITKDNSEKCGTECLAAINAAVAAKVSGVKSIAPAVPSAKTREWVIPMGGGIISENGQWVDIYSAQTQLNTANYPPIQAAYFEVVMGIPNAQGVMQARLYDTSTPYLFAGQVLSTESGPGQFLSVQFPIQSGNKSYHVQLNNSIGTGILDSSRIRLVTQ